MKSQFYINHMNYIYTIYQEKSFTRAAEKLYISQPSLSLTIKKIETEIGYPIFERCGKEVTLTEIGIKYIKAIEEIFKIQAKLAAEVDDLLKLKKGNVTIGSTTFVASYLLPGILKRFKDKYPDIEVSVVVEQSTELEEKLEAGEIDIMIDNATAFLDGYKYIPLLKEHILLGVPKELTINDAYRDKQISLSSIRDFRGNYSELPKTSLSGFSREKFIFLKRGNKIRQIAARILDEHRIIPDVVMEFDRLHTAVSYAEAGFGLSFLTDTTLLYSNTCENLCIYIPDTVYSELTLYIIYRNGRYLSSAAKELVDFIKSTEITPD